MEGNRQRIFELDALRGLCILGMVVVHALMDLQTFAPATRLPQLFWLIAEAGGPVFIVLSGICATLGHRPLRRGAVVLAAGLLCTAVTAAMTRFGFGNDVLIRFGVLHCLGCCMLLVPLLLRLPRWALPPLAVLLVAAGVWAKGLLLPAGRFLFPLGIRYPGFSSADYFPLLPHLGWFTAGIFVGKTLYAKKTTRLPRFPASAPPVRALCFVGRHTLWIYLLHQPVLYGLFALAELIS